MRKPMLNHLINVQPLFHKESNKPKVSQKLDFIPAREPNQKFSPPPAAKRLIIEAISSDEQNLTALPAKNPQHQAQNPNIV